MKRSPILIISLLLLTLLLTLLLRDVIQSMLITPVINSAWRASLFFRSLHQAIYWVILVATVIVIGIVNLKDRLHWKLTKKTPRHEMTGPVAAMGQQIQLVQRGRYFQWLVANRLGILARDALLDRPPNPNAVHPLSNLDEKPARPILDYLEAGLNRSYSQPTAERCLNRRPAPPFDVELSEVIAYLESQMESKQHES